MSLFAKRAAVVLAAMLLGLGSALAFAQAAGCS